MSDIKTIAFVGLGSMGMPMVGHLLRAGYQLRCYARRKEVIAAAQALGTTVCDSPNDAARGAQALICNVTASQDVIDVLIGEQGAAQSLAAGSIVIDHSTIAADTSRMLAKRLLESGIAFLDAPVSGGTVGAQAGTLAVMVGGDMAAFHQALPILRCYGQLIKHVGPSGSGQVVKACNQMVQVVNIQGIAEAMHLAQSQGVAAQDVLECLSAGMAGSKMLDLMGGKMAREAFEPGIQARLHHKDFGLVADLAEQAGLDLPAVKVTQKQLNALMDQGMGMDDTSSLIKVLRQQNLKIKR